MKDGRTHLAYKAEHAVDLDTDLVLAASVYRADHSDYDSVQRAHSMMPTSTWLQWTKKSRLQEAVMDKGYHARRCTRRL